MHTRAVTLFWAPGAPHVEAAHAWLSKRGLAPRLRDVSSDAQALADLLLLAGAPTVPSLAVSNEVAIGFDPARWDEVLGGAAESGPELDTDPESDISSKRTTR